jgi:hypothetical protein
LRRRSGNPQDALRRVFERTWYGVKIVAGGNDWEEKKQYASQRNQGFHLWRLLCLGMRLLAKMREERTQRQSSPNRIK